MEQSDGLKKGQSFSFDFAEFLKNMQMKRFKYIKRC